MWDSIMFWTALFLAGLVGFLVGRRHEKADQAAAQDPEERFFAERDPYFEEEQHKKYEAPKARR